MLSRDTQAEMDMHGPIPRSLSRIKEGENMFVDDLTLIQDKQDYDYENDKQRNGSGTGFRTLDLKYWV